MEFDSSVLVSWINNGMESSHPSCSLIESCISIFKQFANYSISHVYCECNFVADSLANLSHEFSLGLRILYYAPKCVERFVVAAV